MRRVRSEFGEAVGRVLAEHSLSLRAARIRTGIDHVTLSDMRSGYVPRLERVMQFAKGFGLDVNEWLTLAGYEPFPELTYEPDLSAAILHALGGDVDPDDLPEIEAAMRERAAELRERRGAG